MVQAEEPERLKLAGRVEQFAGEAGKNAGGDAEIDVEVGRRGRYILPEARTQRGENQRPNHASARTNALFAKILGEIFRPLGIGGEFAQFARFSQIADQEIGPTLARIVQLIQPDGRFQFDARRMHEQLEHAMPRFEVAEHHAAGDRLGFGQLVPAIVGAKHGGPHPGQYLAGNNLFQNAFDARPMDVPPFRVARLAWKNFAGCGTSGRAGLSRPSNTVPARFPKADPRPSPTPARGRKRSRQVRRVRERAWVYLEGEAPAEP